MAKKSKLTFEKWGRRTPGGQRPKKDRSDLHLDDLRPAKRAEYWE